MAGHLDIAGAARAILKDGKIVEADSLSVEDGVLEAGDASALVTGDVDPGSRISGERSVLVQGAIRGREKDPCRIEVAGDAVIEQGAEHTEAFARTILVGGPTTSCQLVAQQEIRVAEDAAATVLTAGDLSAEKRQMQVLNQAIRKADENVAFAERQLAINQKRLGKAIQRSSFAFDFSEGQICKWTKGRLQIDLEPFYELMGDRTEEQIDRGLVQFFTKGVVGYLARVNRQQILDNRSRQKVFVTLTRGLNELFRQTRTRDKDRSAAAAARVQLDALLKGLGGRQQSVFVGGELLPGSEVLITAATGQKDGEITSSTAGLRITEAEDDDHRTAVHVSPAGEETRQTVEAQALLGATYTMHNGRVVWEHG